MAIQVNLGNRKRKELASMVGTILNAAVSYKGPPTYEYEVGEVTIRRDGAVTIETTNNKNTLIKTRIFRGLTEHGFEPVIVDEDEPKTIHLVNMPDNTVIQVPLEGFDTHSLQNLRALIDSKSTLIKKSMDITDLSVKITNTTVDFPWFSAGLSPKEMEAYTHFITALCNMAKRQKRVIAVEKPTDNEKFTFRLFLVRLGLIGDEYANARHMLLRNLRGNGSWKNIDGKSTQPRTQSPELNGMPLFPEIGDAESAQSKVSFIKRLGYFLLHFDE